ncbi:MAG: helix-turn-helix domain-containing protein, partial [Chloroflexi bacterium]|nr:helix-turn-helix domain-containing protein [Chloroflexota bacterium]
MSKTTPEKKPTGTQAILRAISILHVFTDAQPEWRLSDLVEAVDLNRTTTYRLLTALETTGMVTRDTEGELYRLGSEIIALGGRALRANPLRKVTHPELKRLSSLTGETVTIDILDGCHT